MFPKKAIRFLDAVAKVKKQEKEGVHKDIKHHINRIKEIASKAPGVHVNHAELYNEVRYLEKKISDAVEIMSREDNKIDEIKAQLDNMKGSAIGYSDSGEMKKKLDKIGFLLSEVASRMDSYVKVRSDRENRLQELEKRIKKNMSSGLKEILLLEKQIIELEKRYSELKEGGSVEKNQLERIEKKIDGLKEELFKKQYNEIEKKKEKMGVPVSAEGKRMYLPKPKNVKHQMLFPAPKPKEEEKPAPPQVPLEGEGKMPRPPLPEFKKKPEKKKGLFSRFFGKDK